MKTNLIRLSSFEEWVRGAFVAGYILIIILCFATDIGPRVFWTMALPLLIMSIVLMGFHSWRRICPLAFWGTFGVRFRSKKSKPRRVPQWMEAWFFVISLVFLVIMLTIRLVVINGDGVMLGLTLISLAILAAGTNFLFTGKTWCNFICPVSAVERIYTDPGSLRSTRNSQCAKCTACKRHCPDIDLENAYWKDVRLLSRRIAFYCYPGIVLAFYSYYYLRARDWEAYFDGRWTRKPVSMELMTGPGFFFAPQIPAVIAALLTFAVFALASYLFFHALEKTIAWFSKDDERNRHLTLALASFAAFNIFYLFAGAPTLRLIPGATRIVAFVVPIVSTLYLFRRWRRNSQDYVKEKSVKHLVPLWNFKTPIPSNPVEIFSFFKGQEEAHAAQVNAYEEVVHDILSDRVIMQKDLNLLAQMRNNLSISEREHKRILTELTEEQRHRLDTSRTTTVERRLQMEGYKSALMIALTRQASAEEMAMLPIDYAIEPGVHEEIVRELRDESEILMDRIERRLEKLIELRRHVSALIPLGETSRPAAFVIDILLKSQEQFIRLIFESLRPLASKNFESDLAKIFAGDRQLRASAWESIRPLLRSDIADRLFTILQQRTPDPTPRQDDQLAATLEYLASRTDSYLRACAALLLAEDGAGPADLLLRQHLTDGSDLVRETAIFSAASATRNVPLNTIENLMTDPDPQLKTAAQAVYDRRTSFMGTLAAYNPGKYEKLSNFQKMMHLHQIPLFNDLSTESLDELSRLAKEVELHQNDILFYEGDFADDLFVITAGNAEVMKHQSAEDVLAHLSAGAIIGELAVIDGRPRSATVRTSTPHLSLLRINGEDFRRILAHRPELSKQVLHVISLRLRQVLDSL